MNRHTQTRDDSTPTDDTDDETPMRDVSHTHPHAARGTVNRPFQRGPVVAADGGEREAYDADAREEDDEESRADRMKDVAHTPPYGEGADRVFERGGEREPVESEE
ncbi:hypothetical protein M0R88_17260 [Halorussus gelatinilyticus]|uniref:Uncharacterized protein n=1 Tax=Halorussus gelatinilyticus TaxID=2937524 RepID=A0A8U0IHT6_9EURY|nr:hypothetical protein [Halorussus gelatinilyticus]UPW00246.1 hypothetical protein M0R88_17260 [Halorussus gelatinilyticus]